MLARLVPSLASAGRKTALWANQQLRRVQQVLQLAPPFLQLGLVLGWQLLRLQRVQVPVQVPVQVQQAGWQLGAHLLQYQEQTVHAERRLAADLPD